MKMEYKEWIITLDEAAQDDLTTAVPDSSQDQNGSPDQNSLPNQIRLKCPICGCTLFWQQYVWLNTRLMGMDDDAASFHCQRCGHILWFEPGRVKADVKVPKTPIEKWEFRFTDWGYSEKKLRKIVDDKGYEEPARIAAANLLKQMDEQGK